MLAQLTDERDVAEELDTRPDETALDESPSMVGFSTRPVTWVLPSGGATYRLGW